MDSGGRDDSRAGQIQGLHTSGFEFGNEIAQRCYFPFKQGGDSSHLKNPVGIASAGSWQTEIAAQRVSESVFFCGTTTILRFYGVE
jgi:hypothetical protein